MKLSPLLYATLVSLFTNCASIDVTPEIRGIVVDEESKKPIAAATAQAWNPSLPEANSTARTRSDGRFKIRPVRDTKFMLNAARIKAVVSVQARGYEPQRFDDVVANSPDGSSFVDLGVVPLSPKR